LIWLASRDAVVAAVSRNLSSHDRRHDAATRFWKEYKDVALLQQLLGDRDIKSAMRYVTIGGKEASRLMRMRGAGERQFTRFV
jgi:site-specific recombinase XerD